jgi:transposase InsO family protein
VYSINATTLLPAAKTPSRLTPLLAAVGAHFFGAPAAPDDNKPTGNTPVSADKPQKLDKLFGPQELQLWHRRLGHVNEDALRRMHDDGLVVGLKGHKHVVRCDTCTLAKQTRARIGKELAQPRAQQPFLRVHSDLCGPFRTPGPHGERYLFVITDEFSNFTWAIPLKAKSEVCARVKEWHALVKTQYDGKLREFHSDHGGEFVAQELLDHWRAHGVASSTTSPGTPQHNARAERKNRTLLEATRALLFNAQLPAPFWIVAVAAAVHVLNRTVRGQRRTATPHEMVTGYKPLVGHLRVFGCDAFVHVKDAQGKLAERSKPMLFVGYEPSRMAYKFFDPQRRVIRGADGHLRQCTDGCKLLRRVGLRSVILRKQGFQGVRLRCRQGRAPDGEAIFVEGGVALNDERRLLTSDCSQQWCRWHLCSPRSLRLTRKQASHSRRRKLPRLR